MECEGDTHQTGMVSYDFPPKAKNDYFDPEQSNPEVECFFVLG
jgi:hypothetical protein